MFVWTTADDALVPASHRERFAEACRRAGVAVELTVDPRGPHGMGLALDQPGEVGRRTQRLRDWLAPRSLRTSSDAAHSIASPRAILSCFALSASDQRPAPSAMLRTTDSAARIS